MAEVNRDFFRKAIRNIVTWQARIIDIEIIGRIGRITRFQHEPWILKRARGFVVTRGQQSFPVERGVLLNGFHAIVWKKM